MTIAPRLLTYRALQLLLLSSSLLERGSPQDLSTATPSLPPLPLGLFDKVQDSIYRYYRFADQYEASIRLDVFREMIIRLRELAQALEGYIRSKYSLQDELADAPLFPLYNTLMTERCDANQVNGKILDYISTIEKLRMERLAPPEVVEAFDKEYEKVMLHIMELLDYKKNNRKEDRSKL